MPGKWLQRKSPSNFEGEAPGGGGGQVLGPSYFDAWLERDDDQSRWDRAGEIEVITWRMNGRLRE